MKARIKAVAAILAVILTFSGLLSGSVAAAHDPSLYVPPIQPATNPSEPPVTTTTTAPPPATEPPATQPPATEPAPTEPIPEVEIPQLSAAKAFVYDCKSGNFWFTKGQLEDKIYPASITKLMCVYTAIHYLSPSTRLTMDAEIFSLVAEDASYIGLTYGQPLTVKMAIRAALIASGSDAAHLLAVGAGRVISGNPTLPAQQAEEVFVEKMNQWAADIGLTNSNFINCDGYPDENHYTCMADIVRIANACLNVPLIRDTVRCDSAPVTYVNGAYRTVRTTNFLLRPYSAYYRPQAIGMKTGTSDSAGACLLSAFQLDDRKLLIGIFQCYSNEARFACATTLFDIYATALSHT